MLNIDRISKTFFAGTINERKALVDLSLKLDEGDFVTVIGSNGAGKSTLLNAIAGRYTVDTGELTIDGNPVSKLKEYQRARYVGRVFQDPMAGTAPDLTIEQNLALALQRGKPRGLGLGLTKARRELFIEELKSLELVCGTVVFSLPATLFLEAWDYLLLAEVTPSGSLSPKRLFLVRLAPMMPHRLLHLPAGYPSPLRLVSINFQTAQEYQPAAHRLRPSASA